MEETCDSKANKDMPGGSSGITDSRSIGWSKGSMGSMGQLEIGQGGVKTSGKGGELNGPSSHISDKYQHNSKKLKTEVGRSFVDVRIMYHECKT